MQDIINEDCPKVFEFYPIAFSLRFNWVEGTSVMEYGNGGAMGWCFLTIDSAKREAWFRARR
jgi:hypothetical protein